MSSDKIVQAAVEYSGDDSFGDALIAATEEMRRAAATHAAEAARREERERCAGILADLAKRWCLTDAKEALQYAAKKLPTPAPEPVRCGACFDLSHEHADGCPKRSEPEPEGGDGGEVYHCPHEAVVGGSLMFCNRARGHGGEHVYSLLRHATPMTERDADRMVGRTPAPPPDEEGSVISAPPDGWIRTTVRSCARCGEDHPDWDFQRFTRPCQDFTHWAPCPTNGEPILLKIVTAPPPAEPAQEGEERAVKSALAAADPAWTLSNVWRRSNASAAARYAYHARDAEVRALREELERSRFASERGAQQIASLRDKLAASERRAEEAEGLLRDLEGRVEPALWKRIDAALSGRKEG